jgi:hypothetical protein
MTVRLTGRELLIVCLGSALCFASLGNALPWPEWGRSQIESALIASLTGCVIVSVIRGAMLRDSMPTEPARPSARERTLKQVVFYLLIILVPVVLFLVRARS